MLSQKGFMGLRELRDRARTFLEEAAKTAPLANLQAQFDELKKQLALRDRQLADMIDVNNELKAKVSGGTGSPDQPPEPATPRGRKSSKETE